MHRKCTNVILEYRYFIPCTLDIVVLLTVMYLLLLHVSCYCFLLIVSRLHVALLVFVFSLLLHVCLCILSVSLQFKDSTASLNAIFRLVQSFYSCDIISISYIHIFIMHKSLLFGNMHNSAS